MFVCHVSPEVGRERTGHVAEGTLVMADVSPDHVLTEVSLDGEPLVAVRTLVGHLLVWHLALAVVVEL